MLVKLGGAEKVVSQLIKIFPEADLFTLLYDEDKVWNIFPKEKINQQVFSLRSQKVYKLLKKQRLCLLFMAQSIETLDFSWYDLVIASSSAFTHGAITKPETKFIVYSHSPARYLWDWTNEYKKDIGWNTWIKWLILGKVFLKMRAWDYSASSRPDMILANSKNTQSRITKYHRKPSHILYPPVETNRFSKTLELTEILLEKNNLKKWEYYIIISALTEFKKIDVAVKAFKKISDTKLVIIWQWEHREVLEKQSGKNTIFLWAKYGDELVAFVQNSMGLIFPWEEDFGIVPIEVMAAGKPIFALRKWGLTETVLERETGEFFALKQSLSVLIFSETVLERETGEFFEDPEWSDFVSQFQKFHTDNINWKYKSEACIFQASKFSEQVFATQLKKYIDKII